MHNNNTVWQAQHWKAAVQLCDVPVKICTKFRHYNKKWSTLSTVGYCFYLVAEFLPLTLLPDPAYAAGNQSLATQHM